MSCNGIIVAVNCAYFLISPLYHSNITIITKINHKNATNGSNSIIFASFKRRESYLSKDCLLANFASIYGNLQSN